jgi:hypothetical protein
MPADGESYRETLRVPAIWWVIGLGAAVTVWWVCFVVTPAWVAWAAGLGALALVAWMLLQYGSARVEAGTDGLRAGRALLPWAHVGPSVALDKAGTRRQLGTDADARAYLLLRGYCPGSVMVYVDDEADPTPYWLISSRHPQHLADHLNRRIMKD